MGEVGDVGVGVISSATLTLKVVDAVNPLLEVIVHVTSVVFPVSKVFLLHDVVQPLTPQVVLILFLGSYVVVVIVKLVFFVVIVGFVESTLYVFVSHIVFSISKSFVIVRHIF